MRQLACLVVALSSAVAAEQPVLVRPIAAPRQPLPPENATAQITRFSFIAYGDTRSGNASPMDGDVIHPQHSALVDTMLAKIETLASTPQPVRFVLQSGDAVLRGQNPAMWNVSFSPIIERITRGANVPYFFSVGNHDVTTMPKGDAVREQGLRNTLTAMANLIPSEKSPRRMPGYPTYAFGYGNLFAIAFDTNIADDPVQFEWVARQLETLDRSRYRHIVAFFHHPPFSSGQHGGPTLEPTSAAVRRLYGPLFRKHHVRMTIAGHDHLFDHWIERYSDAGATYRRDDVVTGGGGAPPYSYTSEPDLATYLASGAMQNVRVEHLARPSAVREENLHHFVVVHVDGDRLSLEVVAIGGRPFAPYGGRSRVELNDRVS
jgi:hypothetical protein